MFVAVGDDGAIVGVIVFGPADLDHAGAHAEEVFSLGVARDWRQRRIGSDLKRAALADAAARGVPFVVSQVHKHNFQMHRLNRSLGVTTMARVENEYHVTAVRVRLGLRDRLRHRAPAQPSEG